ncbi:MAG: helix-turn-helix transcriptional regulator [Lachnospiraceae bacterium]|nr:helix-turn-helix transcriptional regulator [Lachnospiraceae bacterium]
MSKIRQRVASQDNSVKGNADIGKKIIDFKETQTIRKSPAGYDMICRDYLVELGGKLKEFRTTKLGCTQDKMADIMNLSQSEISRLEHGKRKINILHLFTLKCIKPNLDLNDLVGASDAPDMHDDMHKEDL